MPIEQSGAVTPGNLALWATTGVLKDGGKPGRMGRVLAQLTSADFNSTSDQPIVLPEAMQAFCITSIIVGNSAISLTTAAGGFYPVANKGGTPIVAASQVYSALTDSTKLMNPTLASYGSTTLFTRSIVTDWMLYFSLTTAQGIAATADIYILGVDLSP